MSSSLPLTLQKKLAGCCALVVIDMQNDFCAPGGYIEQVMGKDVSASAKLVPALQVLLDCARAAAVPVVWVRADYTRAAIPDSMQVKLDARGITADCCVPDTWGGDWFGVSPLAGEAVITKHTYSGFHGTELQQLLEDLGARTLVFAGVQTQVCVESTVRDGHSRGYFCVVPEQAVASHSPQLHQATLLNVQFLFGDVCTLDDVRQAWSGAVASR